MSPFQTIAAAIFITIVMTVGMLLVFRDPIPYAFDNIEETVSQSLYKNGLHWAKVELQGDQIMISGLAPSQNDLMLAKSVVASEGRGVSASFQGIEVKGTVRTEDVDSQLAEIESFRAEFETENPQGRYQLPVDPSSYSGNDSGSVAASGGGGSYGGVSATADEIYNQPIESQQTHSGMVLTWFMTSPDCTSTNAPPRSTFPIFFRGETAAMLAETLSNLDKLSAYNRDCGCQVSISAEGASATAGSLTGRRLDEIRYHLMAAGIEPDAILIQ